MATEEETSEAGDDDGGEKGGGCVYSGTLRNHLMPILPSRTCLRWFE